MNRTAQCTLFILIIITLATGCSMSPVAGGADYIEMYPGTATLDPPEIRDAVGVYTADQEGTTGLPAIVDHSGLMPPAGNQGIQGSCTSWAVAYAGLTYTEALESGADTSKAANQFSPSFLYNQVQAGFVSVILDKVVEQGCDTLKNFPYDQYDKETQPDAASLKRALPHRVASWQYVDSDVDTIKSILADGSVVLFVIALYDDFYRISFGNEVYDSREGKLRGYHTLCMTGYDDSMGAFKFINSWGRNWGFDGYGWIDYNMISDSTVFKDAYVILDRETVNPASTKTIHYYSESYIDRIHYRTDSGSWTELPGNEMVKQEDGWFVYVLEDLADFEFSFTDGWGDWDSNNGSNYRTSLDEVWIYQGGLHPVNPVTPEEDPNKAISFVSSDVLIACDEAFPYTISEGAAWYGFDIKTAGEYTLTVDGELDAYFSLFSNDLTTRVSTITSESDITFSCETGRYFLLLENGGQAADVLLKLSMNS
jgi:hypothetical protein